MGRKKIKIQPIKDERLKNVNLTFNFLGHFQQTKNRLIEKSIGVGAPL